MSMLGASPGAYKIEREFDGRLWLKFMCPCGCKHPGAIAIGREKDVNNQHQWWWDGNERQPTIAPSIRRMSPCGWHGYLQHGLWNVCSDGPPNAKNALNKGRPL